MAKDTLVIACDGPARAGKTTLANNFERKLDIPCINTGKIYRLLAVLAMQKLQVTDLNDVSESALTKVINGLDLEAMDIRFTGKVLYKEKIYDELMTPEIANAARYVSNLKSVRKSVVEPLVINMVQKCEYPVVISEGRDEGRLWRDAGNLGIAIFLSVDPIVAAIRERQVRQSLHYETASLREITNTLMRYDLDNASRSYHPTYIDENPAIFTGKIDKQIKKAIANKTQIIVPTSSVDIATVFRRVVRLAETAGLLEDHKDLQTALV